MARPPRWVLGLVEQRHWRAAPPSAWPWVRRRVLGPPGVPEWRPLPGPLQSRAADCREGGRAYFRDRWLVLLGALTWAPPAEPLGFDPSKRDFGFDSGRSLALESGGPLRRPQRDAHSGFVPRVEPWPSPNKKSPAPNFATSCSNYSALLVAKATFQMLAARQISSTSTMERYSTFSSPRSTTA